MKRIIKYILQQVLNIQEKYYATKCKKHLADIKYTTTNSTSKTHVQAGVKLLLNSKTEENKKKLNKEVKEIVTKNLKEPETLLKYIEENGTKVFRIPYADKILAIVGEQEGFITPIRGLNAVILNIILEQKFSLKTDAMFVLRDMPLNIYTLTHQFHKWYGYRMGLPGFDDKAQEKFKKIWEYEIDENIKNLSYEDIASLKEAIHRDVEAIDFVTKLAKENEGAKKVFENIKNKNDDTNI